MGARSFEGKWPSQLRPLLLPSNTVLSTKAGCECVAHILQTLTDLDGQASVLSVDGIGAYELISRSAMLESLLKTYRRDEILPFVRCVYGWEDEVGMSHEIAQGEGGEPGDPLMPRLFALGLHPALRAAQGRMRVGERIFAYLDDVYVICRPERVVEVFKILEEEMLAHSEIRLHLGKDSSLEQGRRHRPGLHKVDLRVHVASASTRTLAFYESQSC